MSHLAGGTPLIAHRLISVLLYFIVVCFLQGRLEILAASLVLTLQRALDRVHFILRAAI